MKKTPLMISLLIGGVNLCSNSMGATFNVDGHPGLGSYTGYGTCQGCHEDEFDQHANNIMTTTHWTWNVDDGSPTNVGKINVINNYCVAVASNEPRCTSCHIGFGWHHPP